MTTVESSQTPVRVIESPPPPPRVGLGVWGILIRVGVAIAILFGANAIVAGASTLLGGLPALETILSDASWASLAVFIAMQASMLGLVVAALWAWMHVVERRRIRSAGWGFRGSSSGWLLGGVALSGGTVFAVVALLPAARSAVGSSVGSGEYGSMSDVQAVIALTALVSQSFLLQAIPEELLFRGWLFDTMRSRPWLAVAVTTVSFTLIHLASAGGQQTWAERILYLAMPFGFSLLAVGLLLCSMSIWAAIGVHGGFHLGTAATFVLLPQVDPALSWVVIGAVQSLLGAGLIAVAVRRGRVGRRRRPGILR